MQTLNGWLLGKVYTPYEEDIKLPNEFVDHIRITFEENAIAHRQEVVFIM